MTNELHGKKKIIVDESSFYNLDRRTVENVPPGVGIAPAIINEKSVVKFKNGLYLRNGHIPAGVGPAAAAVDWLRLALGAGWEFHRKSLADNFSTFDHNWLPVWNMFHTQPLVLEGPEFCFYEESTDDESSFGLANTKIRQRINVSCHIPHWNSNPMDEDLKEWTALMKTGTKSDTGEGLYPLIKTPMHAPPLDHEWFYDHYHDTAIPFTPEELINKQPVGKAFFVKHKTYYNEIMAAGKASSYENYTSNRTYLHNSLPNIYAFVKLMDKNNLVSLGTFDLKSFVDNIRILFLETNYWGVLPELPPITWRSLRTAPPHTYSYLLRFYPLETLITLYGLIGTANDNTIINLKPSHGKKPPGGTKNIEKIITMSPEKIDITGLLHSYIEEWMGVLGYSGTGTSIGTSQYFGVDQLSGHEQFGLRIGALENIGYNLIFSPNIISTLNKVNKLKNHFPMYNQIEFTANTTTSLGDLMKKLSITRFVSTQIAASQKLFPFAKFHQFLGPESEKKYYQGECLDWFYNSDPSIDEYECSPGGYTSSNRNFYEYLEEKKYITSDGVNVSSQIVSDHVPKKITKTTINFPLILEKWIKNQDYSSVTAENNPEYNGSQAPFAHEPNYFNSNSEFSHATPLTVRDVRNYITYVNKDDEDSINLSGDENAMWKSLLGSAFYAKLADIYYKNKRDYHDLLNGKKAYTEDIFYRIEKHVKHTNSAPGPPGTPGVWNIVQNVIIPNTSELNIAEHIDTQVKYGKHVIYKYKIYIVRAVFGCKYKYNWAYSGDAAEEQDWQIYNNGPETEYEDLETMVPAGAVTSELYLGMSYSQPEGNDSMVRFTASPVVTIKPSIKIIEDEIYDTKEIRILDKPPVSPDVNIVPYRAISNKIKILVSGASDRYRTEPIKILDSDINEFNLIIAAQRSLDGKIEFGSDDPIKNFQVFRIKTKPKTYSSFELHPHNPFIFGGSGVLEDTISPNTKYYYTFRAVDGHGHVSNPTPVYEVELIDEHGAVKPLIRTILLEQTEKLEVKECQKYIYIKPTTKQMFFSDKEEVDSIFSTGDDSGTKKKKYKMRLTSKGSGKKIDINFSFEKKIITD